MEFQFFLTLFMTQEINVYVHDRNAAEENEKIYVPVAY